MSRVSVGCCPWFIYCMLMKLMQQLTVLQGGWASFVGAWGSRDEKWVNVTCITTFHERRYFRVYPISFAVDSSSTTAVACDGSTHLMATRTMLSCLLARLACAPPMSHSLRRLFASLEDRRHLRARTMFQICLLLTSLNRGCRGGVWSRAKNKFPWVHNVFDNPAPRRFKKILKACT